jgi:hypothetical protein
LDESDVFEFVNHFELKVHDWVKGLQAGTMSARQVKKLRTTFEEYLKKVREHESMQGLNATEREAIKNQKRVESREKRIAEIRSDALTFQNQAKPRCS